MGYRRGVFSSFDIPRPPLFYMNYGEMLLGKIATETSTIFPLNASKSFNNPKLIKVRKAIQQIWSSSSPCTALMDLQRRFPLFPQLVTSCKSIIHHEVRVRSWPPIDSQADNEWYTLGIIFTAFISLDWWSGM